MSEVSEARVNELKKRVDSMSHEEMARLYRFAPAGEPIFVIGPVWTHFSERFKKFGGFTPEISKLIGR